MPKITSKEINKHVEPVLREMEKNGIKLDVPFIQKMAKDVEKRLSEIEKEIYKKSKQEFNINSPIQMAEVLFKILKLPTVDLKKTKNGFSTAASELRKIEKKHKVIKPILEYRELSKLLSTYLKPLPLYVDKNSRLHTTYGQDTNTGRLNSSEPNLQNIPIKGELGSEVRKAFVASEGMCLISADYSQIELRVVACLADDKSMKEAFKTNQDIHTRTAAELFDKKAGEVTKDDRRIAKTVNFGVLYGMSPYGLSQALGIDQHKAAEYIMKYFSIHSGIKDYCNRMINHARDEGYVETLFGMQRQLPNINSPYRNISEGEERMAINTPVQGTAAEILKLAMINLSKKLSTINHQPSTNTRMLLTIHDELVIEAPTKKAKEIAKLIKKTMEDAVNLCVPIIAEVKYGDNLAEMKEIA